MTQRGAAPRARCFARAWLAAPRPSARAPRHGRGAAARAARRQRRVRAPAPRTPAFRRAPAPEPYAARAADAPPSPPATPRQALEVQANEIFGAYREQYYEGGTSSVYLWEPLSEEDAPAPAAGAFAGCFLVHKGEGSGRHGGGLERGFWDAIHVAEARRPGGAQAGHQAQTNPPALTRTPPAPAPVPSRRCCLRRATRRRSTS